MLDTELVPAQDKDSRRLTIILHGLGDSMDGYRSMPLAFRLPWMNYLLVNAPDGYYSGFSWFDIYENRAPGIKRSRELLFKLLNDLPGKGFPTDQTILFGFSQGCVMTIEVGCRYPHLLGGLIGISGWPNEPAELVADRSPVATQQRFILTHGLQDPLIPFADADKGVRILKEAGFQIAWHQFRKAHTIIEDEVELFRDFVTERFESKS